MRVYGVALFVHLLGLIALVSGFAVFLRTGLPIRRAGTPDEVRPWLNVLRQAPAMFMSAAILLLLSGLYMASQQGGGPQPFIVLGLGGLILIALVTFAVSRRQLALFERFTMEPQLSHQIAAPGLWVSMTAMNGLAIGVVWDMVMKPDWIESIIALLVTTLIGTFVGASLMRTSRSPRRRDGATMTSSKPRRPLDRRIQAWVMGRVNGPMRLLLRLPIATPMSRRLMLVSFTGRKTGKQYCLPVSYVKDRGTLVTAGGGKWTTNLRAGQPVRLRLRGRDVVARPELIKDPDQVAVALDFMIRVNPTVNRFVGIHRDANGTFNGAELDKAIRWGFRIVRWHLEPQAIGTQ